MVQRQKIIAIVGPTASGKTALGIFLAQKVGGEIISADSRQVYRGLNIGTGKVTKKEMAGVPHHLLDVASPKKIFSASDFKASGEKVLVKIFKNKKVPIIVGGTGLYVDVLVGKMVLPDVPPNPKLRAKLEKLPVEKLFALLEKQDPERAENIEPSHKRRLIRALEIAEALGRSPSKPDAMQGEEAYDMLWLGLKPSDEQLQKNISGRLRARIQAGMLAEGKKLHAQGLSYKRMEELGLEYRSMARYLQKKISKQQLMGELDSAITQYAKRQMRWFKRRNDIHWVKNKTEALSRARNFLKN